MRTPTIAAARVCAHVATVGSFAAAVFTGAAQVLTCTPYVQGVWPTETIERLPDASDITSIDEALAALPRYTDGQPNPTKAQVVQGIERLARAKFHHGYSSYTYCENWVASLAARMVWANLGNKLSPDHILEHRWAGCSQQGIVVQELLRRSGITFATIGRGEPMPHFASAARIEDRWYFVDSWGRLPRGRERLIPLEQIMSGQGLEEDFVGQEGRSFIAALQKGGTYIRSIDEFPGPRGLLFQHVALWVSRFGWIVLGVLALALYVLTRPTVQGGRISRGSLSPI